MYKLTQYCTAEDLKTFFFLFFFSLLLTVQAFTRIGIKKFEVLWSLLGRMFKIFHTQAQIYYLGTANAAVIVIVKFLVFVAGQSHYTGVNV